MTRNIMGLCLSVLLVCALLLPGAGCIKLGKSPLQQPSGNQTIPSGPSTPGPAAPTQPTPPTPPAPPTLPAPPTQPVNQLGPTAPTPPKAPADQSGIGALQGNPPAPAALTNWTGTWQCGQYKMYLTQIGSQVTGWYDNQNGDIEGFAAGSTLVGTWYDAKAGSRDIQLAMSANGNSFTGHYRTAASGNWISNWSCTRISSAIPPAKPSALGPPLVAPTTNWTGSWLCGQWGRLTLSQSGDQVTGSYTYDNGKLTGYAAGNTLVGTWSEAPTYNPPNDAGDVQFNLSADGNSFTGHWRYGSAGDWKPWNGERDH